MDNLRFGVDPKLADEVANFNGDEGEGEPFQYAFSGLITFEEEFRKIM